MAEDTKQESLSELDDRLMADADGSYKQSLIDKLEGYLTQLNSKLEGGALSPDEFEAGKALKDALQQSIGLLKDYKKS